MDERDDARDLKELICFLCKYLLLYEVYDASNEFQGYKIFADSLLICSPSSR